MKPVAQKILVVDDDPDIRAAERVVLERAGYEVVEASDGDQAWAVLASAPPDLVVLDIMMRHDTEGFDLAYRIRAAAEVSTIPIVLLTAFLAKVEAEGPAAFGHVTEEPWPAAVFLEKPVAPDVLLENVRALLAARAATEGRKGSV
jgi:DNA-binding response OmpR family regulator